MKLDIPAVLRRNALAAWGSDGERWLADLPGLVADAAERWELAVGKPFGLSYNWVTAVTRADGTAAVLKLGPAQAGHLRTEAEALDAFAGRGAVRVLERDDDHGALLLERAVPGDRARDSSHGCPNDEAIVAVARRLHREPPPGCALPDVGTLRSSFVEHLARFPGDDPLPRRLVDRANQLFLDLLNDGDTADTAGRRRVVLHGDLHHDNVLAAEREPWLAIDPLGVIGDPGFDAGAMLYNPEPERRDEALLRLVPGRVELLADGLGLPIERVRAWGFVVAVLSEVWTAEGGEPVGGRPLDVALLLEN